MRINGPRCECGGIAEYTHHPSSKAVRDAKHRCRECYERLVRLETAECFQGWRLPKVVDQYESQPMPWADID